MLLKQKFILVGALVLASMVIMMGLGHYKFQKVKIFSDLELSISRVQANMLQLRRDEKDFLARIDLKYQDKFSQNFTTLSDTTDQLGAATREAGLDVAKVSGLKQSFSTYSDQFNRLVATQKKLGLNPKDGLYGSLRAAVHSAETEIASLDSPQLRADMLQLRRNEKDFMLRSDTKYLDSFNKNVGLFNQSLDQGDFPFDKKQIIRDQIATYGTQFAQFVDMSIAKGLASNTGLRGDMRAAVHSAETLLGELSAEMATTIARQIGDLDKLVWITNLIGIALILIVIGGISWVMLSILRPLQSFMDTVLQVTKTNDLTTRVAIISRDEIGKTAAAFNSMMEKFQGIIDTVSHSSNHIALATDEMSSIIIQTCESIEEQKSQTQQLATAMTQMSTTVSHVADNADVAANATKEADQECKKGKEVVTIAQTTISNLASSVQDAANAISLVEEDSNSIGSVLDVIRGIAEQTNLLALNAAIEAARAGEQGRGFAVVADEVRTLAGRTQDSTQEIQKMIESLQSRSQQAVIVMTESHQQTEAGVEQTASVNEALTSIINAVKETNKMNIEIATAASQQSQVTNEVTENVVKIDQIADASSRSAQEISTSSNNLAKLSVGLKEVASQFKT